MTPPLHLDKPHSLKVHALFYQGPSDHSTALRVCAFTRGKPGSNPGSLSYQLSYLALLSPLKMGIIIVPTSEVWTEGDNAGWSLQMERHKAKAQ